MERMISPNGVIANMCCASCKYLGYRDISHRYCTKKNRAVSLGNRCGYYVMSDFFRMRGYKSIKS